MQRGMRFMAYIKILTAAQFYWQKWWREEEKTSALLSRLGYCALHNFSYLTIFKTFTRSDEKKRKIIESIELIEVKLCALSCGFDHIKKSSRQNMFYVPQSEHFMSGCFFKVRINYCDSISKIMHRFRSVYWLLQKSYAFKNILKFQYNLY